MLEGRRSPRTRKKDKNPITRVRGGLNQLRSTGALDGHPNLRDVSDAVMMSGEADATMDFWLGMQPQLRQLSKQKVEPSVALFNEPNPSQLRGDIHIGNTIPSGHDIYLPLTAFGATGHVAIEGTTGAGKTVLINSMQCQLHRRGIFCSTYDPKNEVAKSLVPLFSEDELGVVRFSEYERNPFRGPKGMTQLQWIRSAHSHFRQSLRLSPEGFHALMRTASSLEEDGSIISVRTMIGFLDRKSKRLPEEMTLCKRLRDLTLENEGFLADEGVDLDEGFSRSMIWELKGVSNWARRFLYNEHFSFLVRSEEAESQWRLKRAMLFHESRPLVTASESDEFGESLFFEMMSEIRGYGVGLLLANQVPQREAEVVRSNIGTRIVMKQSSEAAALTFRRLMKLNDEQLHKVTNLEQRQLVMQHPNVAEPFLAEVPNVYD